MKLEYISSSEKMSSIVMGLRLRHWKHLPTSHDPNAMGLGGTVIHNPSLFYFFDSSS